MDVSATPGGGNLDHRKLLYQKYGYDINKLIRTHEKYESKIDSIDTEFNIIDEESDKQDYRQLLIQNESETYFTKNSAKRSKKRNNDQGFRNFTKVSKSFRNLEDSVKKQDTSWLLKDVLRYIKYRSTKLDPFIIKHFTPKTPATTTAQSFILRIVEFGQPTSLGDITAILSDVTHKICVVFPSKSIFNYLASGGLPFTDAYSINNYLLITKSNLKFATHEFLRTHFNLDYVDPKIRYCVLRVLEFKFMYSVEYLLASRVEGAPPWEKVVNENGSQYEVYDHEDFDLGGGGSIAGGVYGGGYGSSCGGGNGVPKFNRFALKLVYNNEFYRRLCYLKPLKR